MSSSITRAAVEADALRLSGWWFDIATGDMYAYRPGADSFDVIDRPLAERLIEGDR
jgi:carbonic anhydrase